MTAWALDLGTHNTILARWDASTGRPDVVELPAVCRVPGGDDPMTAPRAVPSAVELLPGRDLPTRLARLLRHPTWGQEARIGRAALDTNAALPSPAFIPTFKAALGRSPTLTLSARDGEPITARHAARAWLRELLAEVRRTTGQRVDDLLVTVPVQSFEPYRAELGRILRGLGVRRVRFLDEPVAAAVGYGLGLSTRRRALVVDWGAGTLDVALVALSAREAVAGGCEVLAKAGTAIGGEEVDRLLAAEVLARAGLPADVGDRLWQLGVQDEARRVKEALWARDEEVFHLLPPQPRLWRRPKEIPIRQADLASLLRRHGVLTALTDTIDAVIDGHAVDDVLLVGGSTLLPGVFATLEERFGRDRVRAWQPFEAVAWGAAAVAGGAVLPADHIVHDYAIRTHHPTTGVEQHEVIVPRGTAFPTAGPLWTRHLVPTCAAGEPEREFKLVVCEIGHGSDDARVVGFHADGRTSRLGAAQRLVVPLNADAPTLGRLDPPHPPGDRRARLEVSFAVGSERWLTVSVRDLWTDKVLMKDSPVVRLL